MPVITHNDIVAALGRERDLTSGSAPWTLRFIERASAQFREWREIEIDAATALEIILPPHNGEPCKGDRLELVPSGAPPSLRRRPHFARSEQITSRTTRRVRGRIAEASTQPFSTLILTTAPLDADEYRIDYSPTGPALSPRRISPVDRAVACESIDDGHARAHVDRAVGQRR